jgi:hypothetical protein
MNVADKVSKFGHVTQALYLIACLVRRAMNKAVDGGNLLRTSLKKDNSIGQIVASEAMTARGRSSNSQMIDD